jgi:hypothetical protein
MSTTDKINIVISLIAIIIAIMSWRKGRVIYEIKKQEDKNGGEEKIKDLLASGKWTILHVQPHPNNVFSSIYILGRIKSEKWFKL